VSFNEGWEREAQNWIAWARTPGHDAYHEYSPSFFELVPPAGRATLELGCGEGRVARDLGRRGHVVTGVDASPTLLEAAGHADPAGEYVLADAAALPFSDETFDLVVAYNSLMDVQDMPGTVGEAARVLKPDGRFCVSVVHPFSDAGRFEAAEADAPFVLQWPYFEQRRVEEPFERNGLSITFHGWSYPLEDYARAFEDAGFGIEALREPKQRDDVVAADPAEERFQRVPMFLFLRLRRRP
jgi:ubiquinone/menaquinone biosynthesis C-methylase UbiE